MGGPNHHKLHLPYHTPRPAARASLTPTLSPLSTEQKGGCDGCQMTAAAAPAAAPGPSQPTRLADQRRTATLMQGTSAVNGPQFSITVPYFYERFLLGGSALAGAVALGLSASDVGSKFAGADASPVSPSADALLAAGGVVVGLQALLAAWAALPPGYAFSCDANLKTRALDAVAVPMAGALLCQSLFWTSLRSAVKPGTNVGYLIGALIWALFAGLMSSLASYRLHKRAGAPVPRSLHGAATYTCFRVPVAATEAWTSALITWTASMVAASFGSTPAARWTGCALFVLTTIRAAMGAWALRDLTFAAAMAGVLALTLAPHTQARGRVVPLVLWACLAMSVLAAMVAAVLMARSRADAPPPAWSGGWSGGGTDDDPRQGVAGRDMTACMLLACNVVERVVVVAVIAASQATARAVVTSVTTAAWMPEEESAAL